MPKQDYQRLAHSFLDLWQEQLARTMTDGDFLYNLMQQMQQMQATNASAFQEAYSHERKGPKTRANSNPSPASGAGLVELDDLRQRLAICERRLARAERHLADLTAAPAVEPVRKKAKTAAKQAVKSGSKPRGSTRKATTAGADSRPAKPKSKTSTSTSKKASSPIRKRAVKRRS